MVRHMPLVRNGQLQHCAETSAVPVGTAEWYSWLENHRSFSYETANGNVTVRKEQRSNGWYWYAYRRKWGILQRVYLGDSSKLTDECLQLAAQQLDLSPSVAQKRDRRVKEQKAQDLPFAQPSAILLATKLRPPASRPNLVPRAHLLKRLDQGIERKLTLISAPAGFGKTTLLGEWWRYRKGRADLLPVAWLSLDERDNDLPFFWRHVIAALETLRPDLGSDALALLASSSIQPSLPQIMLTALINALNALPGKLALVLDDYHCINEPSLHDALVFFLDHLPDQLHLIISSRTSPPLPLARLHVCNELLEMNAEDLRFTHEEAMAFLLHTMELSLAEEAISVLEMRTEGWVAGLQLAALSLREQKDVAGFLTAFAGSHRYIFDYLSKEIFARQPEPVKTFLLATCILERMSSSLCNALTQRTDGQAMLLLLEQKNLFIVPLDNQRTWYRYHQLFADALLADLQQRFPEEINILHGRASVWYELYGFMREAIDHAFAAGDQRRAAQLIEQSTNETTWHYSEIGTLRRWFDLLPPDIIRSGPQLCLLQAWIIVSFLGTRATDISTMQARLEEMVSLLQRAEGQLSDNDADREVLRLQGEIAALSTCTCLLRAEYGPLQVHAKRAFALLSREYVTLRALVARMLYNVYVYSGDVKAARVALQELTAICQQTNDQRAMANALFSVSSFHFDQGQLHQAFAAQQEAIRLAKSLHLEEMLAAHQVGLSRILLEWNELESAAHYLLPSMAQLRQCQEIDPGILLSGYQALVAFGLATRDSEGVMAAIDEAEVLLWKNPQLPKKNTTDILAAQRAQLSLVRGDLEAANAWARTCEPIHDEDFALANVTKLYILARVYLANGNREAAISLLERLFLVGQQANHVHTMIQTLVLLTLACTCSDNASRGIALLVRALSLAEPGGYVRIFVEEGETMITLLSHILAEWQSGTLLVSPSISPGYIQMLLAASIERAIPRHPFSKQMIVPILSAREQEIVRLIAQGLSDREIAQRLVLAESTVKTHARRIYVKLEVKNRTQAVMRARELQILS